MATKIAQSEIRTCRKCGWAGGPTPAGWWRCKPCTNARTRKTDRVRGPNPKLNGYDRRRIPADQIVPRFWAKVNKHGPIVRTELGPCWLWTGGTNGRYGTFNIHRRHVFAHRFVCELTYGPLHQKQVARHRCDTPLCVRPEHILPGTHEDNMADAQERGRLDRSVCRNGHVYAEVGFTRQSDSSKSPGKKQCRACMLAKRPPAGRCTAINQTHAHGRQGQKCERWAIRSTDRCSMHPRMEAERAREQAARRPLSRLDALMDRQLSERTGTVSAF